MECIEKKNFKVQYTRFFKEFDLEDVDTLEFDTLAEANKFYELHKKDKNVQLWAGKDRIR